MRLKSPEARIGMWTYKQIQIQEAKVRCSHKFYWATECKTKAQGMNGRGIWTWGMVRQMESMAYLTSGVAVAVGEVVLAGWVSDKVEWSESNLNDPEMQSYECRRAGWWWIVSLCERGCEWSPREGDQHPGWYAFCRQWKRWSKRLLRAQENKVSLQRTKH